MPEIAYSAGPRRAAILGIGSYVPEERLTNEALTRTIETSDSWIRQRTGIAERRIGIGMTTAQMSLPAATAALRAAEVLPEDLDLIIVGTSTPDRPFPAVACELQRMIGAKSAMAFDVLAACSSWLYAASIAERYIAGGSARRVLVLGSEVMSRIMDYRDRSTCILFGDGAGAAVLGPAESGGFLSFVCGADGNQAELIRTEPDDDTGPVHLRMDGPETFKVAPRTMEGACRAACEQAGVTLEDIKVVIPHQANSRIVEVLARRLRLPLEMFLTNIEMRGNTSSASIPLVLDDAVRDGRIVAGDLVLLVAFGAGLTWVSTVVRWGI
ncbi:MAG: 3-oxoacyl-[acyl-carrier-protein] synthase [Chloroflexota bacterium]|jgi:3-oxoacyl-[acyl-carrier-protein] synthase-3|nr:3-oxoacyl-[acyl-carrier-protein] synthase [Chloroflexota bacterium]